MNYIYMLTLEDDVDRDYRLALGTWLKKEYAIASAFNVAPSTAKIILQDWDCKSVYDLTTHLWVTSGVHELRTGTDDTVYETYTIRELRLETEVFAPPAPPPWTPPANEEREYTHWPEEEGDYSQWYDRQPGDHEMPDNYPEAVDPEDFAPTDYDDDDDLAASWLESAIDEVNYEQDHL